MIAGLALTWGFPVAVDLWKVDNFCLGNAHDVRFSAD